MIVTDNQIAIFVGMRQRKEEHLKERDLDKFYADSWDQAAQISEEMDVISAEISTLNKFIESRKWNKKISRLVQQEIIRRRAGYRYY